MILHDFFIGRILEMDCSEQPDISQKYHSVEN